MPCGAARDQQPQVPHDSEPDLLVPAPPQGRSRAVLVGAFVFAAGDEDLDEAVFDRLVRYPGGFTAQRMAVLALGQAGRRTGRGRAWANMTSQAGTAPRVIMKRIELYDRGPCLHHFPTFWRALLPAFTFTRSGAGPTRSSVSCLVGSAYVSWDTAPRVDLEVV